MDFYVKWISDILRNSLICIIHRWLLENLKGLKLIKVFKCLEDL